MSDNLDVATAEGTRVIRTKEISTDLHAHVMLAGEHVRVFVGVQSIADTTSSQTLTVPSGATHALIYNEGSATDSYVRYWTDGTAPTSGTGKKLKDHEEIACASPSTFKFIRSGGTNTLRVEFYKYL